MGHYVEGIADNLSREFHAMSSRRNSQWWSPTRGVDEGLHRSSSPDYFSSAYTRPLRYGSKGRSRGSSSRRRTGELNGRYDTCTFPWDRLPTGRRTRAVPVKESIERSASEDQWRRDAAFQDRRGGPRQRQEVRRGGDRWYDASSSSFSSYTSSDTYSYSSRDSNSLSSSSEAGSPGQKKDCGVPRVRAQRQRKLSGSRPSGSPGFRLRFTPVGHLHLDASPANGIRWVDDDRRDQESVRGAKESKAGFPLREHLDLYGEDVAEVNPTTQPGSLRLTQMPSLQPSGFLQRVISAVAYYRGVPPPPSVPREVILAFDEYVSPGSMMLKFIAHGSPHSRFFVIRFLDVISSSTRFRGGQELLHQPSGLYAVLSWYHKLSSRHMIRFLPLHDLIEVKANGADHKYVRRRVVQPGVLRGPWKGFVTSYMRAEFILQFRFFSRFTRAEETLAMMAENRAQYLAWLVVGSFISQIGRIR
ncbi:hypothetical protein JKF63_01839 [Porcisia hertigi]|uniref:PH-like domain-containing protein n=1 Tax=Porcisia hertigi TaxID=2761500 RepID=A0A836IBC0_9TRYP|nr:hypothetical protein JKF63_01839 [Porcisia hertigi]